MTTAPSALRGMRHAAGLTLRGLGEILGITHVYVSEVERGIRPMPLRLAAPWGKALGLDGAAAGRAPERIDLSELCEEDRARVAALAAELRKVRAA